MQNGGAAAPPKAWRGTYAAGKALLGRGKPGRTAGKLPAGAGRGGQHARDGCGKGQCLRPWRRGRGPSAGGRGGCGICRLRPCRGPLPAPRPGCAAHPDSWLDRPCLHRCPGRKHRHPGRRLAAACQGFKLCGPARGRHAECAPQGGHRHGPRGLCRARRYGAGRGRAGRGLPPAQPFAHGHLYTFCRGRQ